MPIKFDEGLLVEQLSGSLFTYAARIRPAQSEQEARRALGLTLHTFPRTAIGFIPSLSVLEVQNAPSGLDAEITIMIENKAGHDQALLKIKSLRKLTEERILAPTAPNGFVVINRGENPRPFDAFLIIRPRIDPADPTRMAWGNTEIGVVLSGLRLD